MSELLAVSTLRKLRQPDVERLVVAVSGGVDSAALLHAVSKSANDTEIQGLHIHHGLVPNADQLAEAAQDNCKACHIPFVTIAVKVALGGSLEAAARKARYDAFSDFLLPGDLLLLAHHADDQVETALFRLFRGSRVPGLQGMPEERQVGRASLYRPLLRVSRQKILDYARSNKLRWIDDDSNSDLSFDRNYIRHNVLPIIENRWPEIRSRLLSAVERDARAQSKLIEHHSRLLDTARLRSDCLDIEALQVIPQAELVELLAIWLNELGIGLQPGRFLREIAAALVSSKRIDLSSGPIEVRQHKGRIYALNRLPISNCREFRLRLGDTPLAGGTLKNMEVKGIGLRLGEYCVRFREGGESLRKRRNRSLKNLWQEAGLPSWLRSRVPLIYKGEELVAMGGVPGWNFAMQIADGYGVAASEVGFDIALYLEDRI